jgi:DNA polymerase
MAKALSAAPWVPPEHSLSALRESARHCQGCPLYQRATQTVFGAGSVRSSLVLIGEQPGDQEDQAGLPFVGPAGHLLDRALERAGIARNDTYVTNAVKHFKWRPAGKRRLHEKPTAREVAACRPWLDAELDLLHPRVVVALGATAAQALLGKSFRVTQHRGEWIESPLAWRVMATVHPSSILRAPDDESRAEAMEAFVTDLRKVGDALR